VRILFLSQLLPLPLDAGPKIRAYYVLRHLAAAGHDVTAICFVRPDDQQADVRALERYCRSVETVLLRRSRLNDAGHALRSMLRSTPFLIERDRLPAMASRVAQVMSRCSFDAVHADQLWMAPHAAGHKGLLRVLDQHNAVFRVPQQMAEGRTNPLLKRILRSEAHKLATFEKQTVARFDRVVWVSTADRDALVPAVQTTRDHHVIPIAVDPAARQPVRREAPFRVTFVGGLHWPPNAEGVRWFARRCWPLIARAVPRAVLTVVGHGALRAGLRTNLRQRFDVVGHVDDLQQVMSETAVFVVPLKSGAGMRVKILEAWCWAVPVVSTAVGAEGVRAVDGEQMLVADDEASLTDAVIRVLTDTALARRLSESGRSLVEQTYNWRQVYRAWDQVYRG